MSRTTQQLIEQAERRGWKFHRITGTGHVQMTWPGGGKVTFSSTPHGSKRGPQNAQADMRRVERMNPLSPDAGLTTR